MFKLPKIQFGRKAPLRGDELLKIAAIRQNLDVSGFVSALYSGGANDEDIRSWWNMPDSQQEEIMESTDAMYRHIYEQHLQGGKTQEEARLILSRGFPIYGEYEAGKVYGGDDILPWEMKPRVDAYMAGLADKGDHALQYFKDESAAFSSMNQYLRKLLA